MTGASMLEHFAPLSDPRIARGKAHQRLDIEVLAICAGVSGAEGWATIEELGHTKLAWLCRFVPLANRVPTGPTTPELRVLSRVSEAPQNFAVLRRMALNLLKRETTMKKGVKQKRLKAGWDDDYLAKGLFKSLVLMRLPCLFSATLARYSKPELHFGNKRDTYGSH